MNTISNRQTKGFTMMELMASIALLVIAAGLVFVSIFQYQRAAYFREMEETAKEIYIAAQNHLTVAESLGTLSRATPSSRTGTMSGGNPADPSNVYYYYVTPADRSLLSDRTSILHAMLPVMSIDETIRSNGSYIIRYQVKGSTYRVLDVFYAKPGNHRYAYEFGEGELPSVLANYTPEDGSYNGAVIGHYDGSNLGTSSVGDALNTPELSIRNAEVLAARVTNPSPNATNYEFYATGVISGAISNPVIVNPTGNTRTDANGKSYIEVIFDAVTEQDGHFSQLESMNESQFIPGEDITIQVFAIGGSDVKVSKSAKYTTNSLFASVGFTSLAESAQAFKNQIISGSLFPQSSDGAASGPVAKITNIRHLENMNKAVSGFDPESGLLGEKTPATYEQTHNLSWPDFCKAIAGLEPDAATGEMPDDTDASRAVAVYTLEGASTPAHTYLPVDWSAGTLVYEGNGLKVSDVEVSASANAGLFGTVTVPEAAGPQDVQSRVSNLELINFKVETTSGNAGTLAGDITNLSVNNVLAHDEGEGASDATAAGAPVGNAAGAITGTLPGANAAGVTAGGIAGGLVGNMVGGAMKACAAAEYVSGASAAGGLIGQATGVQLQYSYAGGHTNNGAYGTYEKDGRYAANVLSNGVAGGLVGSFASGSATGCYSTCSVRGATAQAAALVGSGSATVSNSTCFALGSVNDEAWDITDTAGNELNVAAYDSLVAGGKNVSAPYDATLIARYASAFPFKTIAEIEGVAAALELQKAEGATQLSAQSEHTLIKHLNMHYGDWPAIVTTVKNG